MNCKMPVPGNKWYHGGGLVDELIGVAVLFGYPIHSTSQSKIVWICKQIFPHLQAWLSFRTLWYDIVNFMYLVYSKQYRLWKEIEKKLIPPFPDTHRKPPHNNRPKKSKSYHWCLPSLQWRDPGGRSRPWLSRSATARHSSRARAASLGHWRHEPRCSQTRNSLRHFPVYEVDRSIRLKVEDIWISNNLYM